MSQVCNDFLQGRCFRATCRFSHEGAGAPGGYGAPPPAYGGGYGCVARGLLLPLCARAPRVKTRTFFAAAAR
jgi:hypothetical protein